MSNDCVHEWEDCGFTRTLTGTRWRNIEDVSNCAKCGTFGGVTRVHLDGTFCRASELRAVREKEQVAFEEAKREWLGKREDSDGFA